MAIVNATARIDGTGGQSNYIRNPRMEGAVVGILGSGGALPTGWVMGLVGGPSGVTEVIGTGVDVTTGLTYIDIRVSGSTTAGTNNVRFMASNLVPTIAGDQWSLSMYLAVVAGAIPSTTQPFLYDADANGTLISDGGVGHQNVTLTSTLQRFTAGPCTVASANARFAFPMFQYSYPTGTVDFTIRFAGIQLELETAPTPIMLPPVGSPGVSNRAVLAQPTTWLAAWKVGAALIAGRGGPTNYIRNPRAEGAVVGVIGSGGALPSTGWGFVSDTSGLTKTIIGTGTDGATGLPYIDIQYSGTTAVGATFLILGFDNGNAPSAPFDQWSQAVSVALVGGSLANITSTYFQIGWVGGGSAASVNFGPSLTGALQRFFLTGASLVNSTAAQSRFNIQFATTGVAINVTFRIAAPQLERAASNSPVILPPVGAPATTNAPLVATPMSYPATTKLAYAQINGVGNQVNLIRNPLMLGGVTGSPGTQPTYWSTAPPAGVTRSSCNYGVDATTGLPYVEFRFTGTATTGGGNSGGNIRWDNSVGINCNPGDTFSQSIYAAITAGDLTNVVNFTLGLYTTDATGTIVTAPSYTTNPLAINDVMQRFAVPPFTLTGTTTIRHVWPTVQMLVTTGQPVDYTLRLSAPQVEFAGLVTDVSMPPDGTMGPTDRVLTPAMVYALQARAQLDGRGGQVNLVRNPRGEGAIPGTPGTAPTYWTATLVGGLSRQIVGTGTDVATGLNYVDFRYFGTATTNSNNIRLELNNGIVASPGDTWSTSIYAALVGGSTNGGQVTFQYGLYVNDINGGIITAPVPWIPVTLTGTLQRFFDYADVITNDPATGFVWPVFAFVYPPGSVVDFTVRLAGAQVEYGSNVTDLLLPPPGTPRVTDRVITPDSTVVSVIIGGQGGMTNWIDNPNAEGAVVGTPGTPPTNWSWSTTLGIATQVVATGNADPDRGLPYIDIRLSGTPTATGGIYLRLATTTSIPGLSGDGWSQSVHAALVGGSTVNLLSVGQVVLYLTTAGTLVTNTGSTQFTPTATLQRFSISNRVTPVGATIRRVCPVLWFQLTIGNAIDLTLRIAAPQFESNPVVTPPILPPLGSPGVTTRALLAQPTTLVAAQARIDGIGGFTNWMTNPNGIGGVVGTSTLPTNWSAGNTAASWTVVGTGTVVTDDDAKTLNYVDIRFNATPTSSGNTLRLDLTTAIPTQPSAIWSMSMYVALVGGSLAAGNVAMGQILYAISATGVNLAGTGQINFTPTASLQRFFLANRTMPTAYPDTRYVWPVIAFGYTQGAAVDFTLRIAGIQLEAGSVCTPVAVPSAANFGPFTRGLLAMPTVANFAQINGVGTLRAAAAKITTAQGQIGGAGNVRATAVVRAGAQAEIDGEGFVSATGGGLQFARAVINGGEGNRLNARGTPGPQTPNTCVVSTDIPSPFGDNSLVFKHTAFNSTNATNCGALGNTTGPLNIPYTINVWVWLPAGWAGSELHFPVEGLAYPNLSYPFTPDQYADLTLTNQWQLVSYQLPTSPVGAGTFSMVCRPVDPTATSFYTSLWAAVPDTLAAAPTQTMRGLAEIDGEGFVVPAPLGRVPTSARIAGVGSFAATVFSTRAASAEIDGVGTPRANVTPLRPASAEIDGAGFITATPSAFATQAQARIAGVGSVAADGQPMRAAAARINGVGGVRATVSSRFVAASAEIDGQGGGKTNYIRNPRLEGAVVGVVGSGGLRPTFWVVGGDPMAWDVVSIGVEDGLSYVDIRWHGISTATANSYILPEGAIGPNQPQSFPGLTSTSSLYCRLVGGDLTNVNRVQLSQQDRASDQTYISGNAVLFTLPGGVTLGTQRFAVSWTSSATGAFMVPVIYAFFNAGSLAIDFTLRIGGLQQEWGALATQLILPPAGIFGPWMRGIDAGARLLLPAAGEIDGEGFVTTSPGRLLPAQARIAGLGSLQVDARPARAASAEIDGEGFVIPALTTRALITLEIDGEGFVLATATPLRPTQARIDGVGTVRAIGGAILLAAARLNGVGSCNILPTGAQLAQLEIDGQGSLRANAVPARGATAAVAGIGSVSATATVRVAGLAEIDGEGFITAPGMGLRPALGRIDGLGSFVALASARARASAEIDGEGFPTGDAQRVAQLRQALAEIDGVGTIRATAVAQMLGAALIAGLGQVRADGLAQHPSGSQVIPGEGFVLTVATAVVQAAALIAGTGGVTAVSRAALPAGAGIAGTGSLTADSVPRRAGVARITGDAGVAATAQLLLPAQARIAGQGSLTADTLGEDEGAARIDGLGALRADGLVQRPANARIDGLGTVRAAAAVPAQAAAEIDGAGSVRAAVQGATPAQARLAGVGSLRVDALVQRPASATIAGVGTLAAQAIRLGAIVPASARIDGVGAVAAAGGGLNLIAARIDGVGAVLATITANREAAARINGIGGVQAAALYLGQTPAAGLIAGRGGVFVAMPALRARVLRVAPIGAVGHIAASATVIATAAARIRGVGGVSLAAVESHPAAARIAGTGRVRMTAHLAFAARATLHGIGLLRAKVSAEIHAATARIAGTGSVRAATSGHFTVPAAARIDGTGALRATTTARRDAAALLAGEGDLDTHGRPAQFAEAAIVGTGRVAAHASVAARMAASRLNGVGSVRATGARVIPAGAVIFGRGYIDANGTHEVRDGAAIVGVGRVQANATQVHQTHPAAAVIHGTGSLRVTRARLHAVIAAVLTGIGRAVARGSIHAPADARVGGRGLVRADAVKAPRVAGAILTGHGGVHANAQVRHYVHASARITGSGHLAAAVSDVLQSVHASARIHGLGAVHADSDVHEAIHAAARIDGHGLLRQFPIPGWFHASARARIGGHGAVHAIAHVAHPARARIIGLGRVRAALHRLVLASAHIAGVGQVRDQVVVHTLVYAEARIDGAGRLRTDPHIPRERVAALGVYLPPTPRGAAIPPQTGGDVTLPPTRRSVTV